ncbi:MAG: ATP-dependent zinc metalloprotease FtsH [Patescibacteria group bacterium]
MKVLFRSIGIVFLALLGLSLVISLVSGGFSEPERAPLSTIVEKLNAGQIKEITVEEEQLKIVTDEKKELISRKEPGVSVFETLISAGANKDKLAAVKIDIREPSGWHVFLTTVLPNILPFIFVGAIFWFFFRQAQKGSMQAMNFGRTKAKLVNGGPEGKKRTMFRDVAGLIEAKEEVKEIVEFLREPKKFHKLGARIPRGVLLVGGPGTGKTLLAKAVANEAGVPFFYVSGSEFVEMFVGVGANRVRDTFEQAKAAAPAIIFVDEIDAVGRHRGAGFGGGHDEREQTLNQILVEMDGFETNNAVIVMAATNRPDILDPALLRPGRFDRRIILDEPSLNDREAILKIHAEDKPLSDKVNLRVVAERTPGFSGADLANLINESAILAARKGRTEIIQEDLFQSIEKVMLGPERRSHVLSVKEKKITAYHEAGHAIIAATIPHADPVHKVSIVSRGRAGGYTLKLPSEDKHMRSRSEFESELAVLLGGYTAEKIIFKEMTTGASNDLKVASDIARKMVTQYGMSEKIGPIAFNDREEMVFLGKEIAGDKNHSETTALLIDTEISKLITDAFKSAKTILTERSDDLERVAQALLEKEVLEQKEFYALIRQNA